MEFAILGALEGRRNGLPVPVSSPREQRLLAVLLLSPNQVVPLGQLLDAVWDDNPPASAKRQVQNRLSAMRRRLDDHDAAPMIVADGPGYRIRIAEDQLDASRFQKLVAEARRLPAAHRSEACDLLGTALSLWRGPALAGLTGRKIEAGAARLDELRLTTYERYFDLQLDLGRHSDIVGELNQLVAIHPMRERLVGQLILALHRSARRADALRVYEELRRRLADDLGVDPSAQLQHLHAAILRDEPNADSQQRQATMPARHTGAGRGPEPLPRQLPAVTAHFVGRSKEIAQLDQAAKFSENAPGAVVSVITGPAGVGKTTIALHWAHRAADRFPGGQLYVNLRGFDPTGHPVTPAEALRGFLDAFAVPAGHIPASQDAQAALFRSLLSGRRVLVILDNARDAQQVRPLLPGSRAALVVVTSRNRLASLVAVEDAHPITVDLLSEHEAQELLASRVGSSQRAPEQYTISEIVAACGRLPLALAIVAARAATHPTLSWPSLALELRRQTTRLDALSSEDAVVDIRSVFSWSYQQLSLPAARLFQLLGLHPGPDLAAPAAASLAGVPLTAARAAIAELVNARLISEHGAGRFVCHDLLRMYARELADAAAAEVDLHAAATRMFDYYLHTAWTASRLLHPHQEPLSLAPASPGTNPEDLKDREQASAWFGAEHRVLVAAVRQASAGLRPQAWQLAHALRVYLDRGAHWQDLLSTQTAALAAAEHHADVVAQAQARRGLGAAYDQLGRPDIAVRHLRHAVALHTKCADRIGEARIRLVLTDVFSRQRHHKAALRHALRALDLFHTADYRPGEASAHNAVGWCQTQLGAYEQALGACQRAYTLFSQIGDQYGQAMTSDSLGFVYHHLGDYQSAVTCYRRAIDLCRDLGNPYDEANTWTHLGDTHNAAGEVETAHEAWRHALNLLEIIDHPEAEQVRARLK